jgi:hypothetical protein
VTFEFHVAMRMMRMISKIMIDNPRLTRTQKRAFCA